MYDNKYSWNNYINSCIDNYLRSQIRIVSSILSGSENYRESYISTYISGESRNNSENGNSKLRTSTSSDFALRENSNDLGVTQKYKNLWVKCEICYGLNYIKKIKSKMNIYEQCGYYLKMSSSDRIELSVDLLLEYNSIEKLNFFFFITNFSSSISQKKILLWEISNLATNLTL